MELKVWYLPYCSHCKRLMAMLKEKGVRFEAIDAESFVDESRHVEQLVDTQEYPILEVYIDQETIYFIPGDYTTQSKIDDGVYKETYQSIDNLVYQVQQLTK